MKKIGFDLQGGDNNTDEALKALGEFLKTSSFPIVLYVLEDFEVPKAIASKVEIKVCKQLVLHTDGLIEMRRKKDSTMSVAMADLVAGKIDGLLSAGASGPLVASSYLVSKSINDKIRPAFAPFYIGFDRKLRLLIDAGANVEPDLEQLIAFAKMGSLYYATLENEPKPKVGLLNIGVESKKGTPLHQQTHQALLNQDEINFVGNIEPDKVMSENIDVLLSDGFSGNILLKAYEGAFNEIRALMKREANESKAVKAGLFFAKSVYNKLSDLSKHEKIGGAIVLGINHLVIKVHGSADFQQFLGALKIMEHLIDKNLIGKIKESI